MNRILIIDDDEAVLRYLSVFFMQVGKYEVRTLADSRRALEETDAFQPALLLLDIDMPHVSGIDILERLATRATRPEVLVLSGVEDVKLAVRAMKLNAYDYLTKPLDTDKLLLAIERALERHELKSEVDRLKSQLAGDGDEGPFAPIITRSPQMREVFKRAEAVAPTDNSVLIWGESGTGKELIARALHKLSRRRDRPLIAINAGVFASELFAAQFFGHTRGAFTGAVTDKAGLLEKADGGTLFLDEIGELSLAIQVKLLRVLQDGEYAKVGSTENRHVDARIITATNKDLRQEIERNNFRADLFFRLDVCSIYVPPLRERVGDLPLLAQYFLSRYARIHDRPVERICPDVLELMARYSFPGNVRELDNIINSAVLLEKSNELRCDSLPQGFLDAVRKTAPTAVSCGNPASACMRSLAEVEREQIERVLGYTDGNRSAAARILGISRVTLAAKLKQYSLES